MGLSEERGEETLPRGEEGAFSEPDELAWPPELCCRIKRARREGVLGLGWTGDSEVGLPNTIGKNRQKIHFGGMNSSNVFIRSLKAYLLCPLMCLTHAYSYPFPKKQVHHPGH